MSLGVREAIESLPLFRQLRADPLALTAAG